MMAKMKKYKSVEHYFQDLKLWKPELTKLREIVNKTCLKETLKWSIPCYTHNGKNVIGISGFQSHFGIWFFQGALLGDPEGVLINAQEGKTQAQRQWRMKSKKDIKVRMINFYLAEAIELVEAGRAIKPKLGKPVIIDPLLQTAFSKNKKAKANFEAMSLSCRREYADHINDAKREETKVRRIAKIVPMIVKKVGLNDKYR